MKSSKMMLLALALATSGAPTARALEWETTSATLTPQPGRDAVLATFRFVNHGKATVHVLGVQTSCGCTDAVVNPNDIPAGASGTAEVLFTIGKRTGRQVRDVYIQTDDVKAPAKLTLVVDIPAQPKPAKPAGQ